MKLNLPLILSLILFTQAVFATAVEVSVTCKLTENSTGVDNVVVQKTQTLKTDKVLEVMEMIIEDSEPITIKISTQMTGFNNPITAKIEEVCFGGKCVEGEQDLYFDFMGEPQDEMKLNCYNN